MSLVNTLEKVFGKGHKSGNEFYVQCPYCIGGKTGNARQVMGINLQKLVFGCNRCGEAGTLSDLKRDFSIKFEGLDKLSQISIGQGRTTFVTIDDLIRMDDAIEKEEIESYDCLYLGFKKSYEYAKSRFFLSPIFNCMYSNLHPYYCLFPIVNDNGKILYYQGRKTINDNNFPKTINPSIPKPPKMFSPHGIGNMMILVEGIADAINIGGTACLGKKLTKDNLREIGRMVTGDFPLNEIFVCFDEDAKADTLMTAAELSLRFSCDIKISVVDWSVIRNNNGYGDEPLDPGRIVSSFDKVKLIEGRVQYS